MTARPPKAAALALASFASLAALGGGGCMHFEAFDEPIQLQTHVSDWRDEVIYQILVDRFADGDDGNNYNLDLTANARYHGGDWKGIEDNLDYLEELGVTTLWISPVVKNVETDANFDGYHGYWAQDFTETNPHFGDIIALRSLVDAAHERDMKIIIDIVTNHVGQAFFYDINNNGVPDILIQGDGSNGKSEVKHVTEYDPDFDSRGIQAFTSLGEAGPAPIIFQYDPASNHIPPYPEIFSKAITYNRKGRTFNFDIPDQLLHGDFPGGLKDIDTTRCDVKREFVDVYARWIELTDADGYRIDTIKHVEYEFWRYFTQRLRQRLAKSGKKNFLMFGEAFDGNDALVGSFTRKDFYNHWTPDKLESAEALARDAECGGDGPPLTGDMLDSVFYFPQHYQAFGDVIRNGAGSQKLADLWASRTTNYGNEPIEGGIGIAPTKAQINFIDNHDVARFLFWLQNEPDAVKYPLLHNALFLLLTMDGIPCIYYGTEQDFDGGNDPSNRENLWSTDFDTSGTTFRLTQRLIRLRRAYQALRKGDTRVVWATENTGAESDAGIFAWERFGGDAGENYALMIMNNNRTNPASPEYMGARMQLAVAPGTVLVDVLSADKTQYTVEGDGGLGIVLPPITRALLIPAGAVVDGL
ncbi:MAG: alpha-amylase [Myxococcales bacterium]|nr:alpha-amylase [Myxococcales bacterium]MCB9702259.1 alpha-amylase [Myxococcales bacterium]